MTMELHQFDIGARYQVKTKDFEVPDGSGTIAGKDYQILVLPPEDPAKATVFNGETVEPATPFEIESRRKFLRVQRENGCVHLLHPETIATAQRLA